MKKVDGKWIPEDGCVAVWEFNFTLREISDIEVSLCCEYACMYV